MKTETPKIAEFKLLLNDGKYTYVRYQGGGQEVLRHGEQWRDLTGDNLALFFGFKVEELFERVLQLEGELKEANRQAALYNDDTMKVMAQRDQLKRELQSVIECLRNREKTLEQSANDWVDAMTKRDQWKETATELAKSINNLLHDGCMFYDDNGDPVQFEADPEQAKKSLARFNQLNK